MDIPSQERLEEIVKKLQAILRIQDWDIEINVLSGKEFTKKHDKSDQAHNHLVRLLNSSYIDINKDETKNWYISLLHELLHLAFDSIDYTSSIVYNLTSGKAQKCLEDVLLISMEQTVEKMARILADIYPVTNFISEGGGNDGQESGT